ncbi:hypothetical protein OEV98_04470 [Caldibacillus lycopersici]|uniref:Uncharacterized protein n=1 Tax=Perspicuibacillus lycopersici TaxID=1325689 RepID=A0AAE3IQY1_9BACI|nr:hypothetical protein [Perspicuibacillus lycopersici]MCU9612802.1 hypothetical protein [Perspicuibacillus lycopersici]
MEKHTLLFLAAILAGFALYRAPIAGSVLAGLEPVTSLIGLLAILVFSIVLIIKAILALLGR